MGVLTKARLIPQQRYDLEDLIVDQNAEKTDSKFWTKQFLSAENYVLKGFVVTGLGLKDATIVMADSTFIHAENTYDFSWFTAEESPTNITISDASLQDGVKNYIELKLVNETNTPLTKAFWDKAANSGLGAEFNQETDTVEDLAVEAVVVTGGFSGSADRIPIAIVEVDGSGNIVGILDKRKLFFRLGEPGDASREFSWITRQEPNQLISISGVAGSFVLGEILTFSGGATATVTLAGTISIKAALFSSDSYAAGNTVTSASGSGTVDSYTEDFTGADKDIANFKDAWDATWTEIKALKGTAFWHYVTSSSVAGVAAHMNSSIVANVEGAQFRWNGSDLSITQILRPEITKIVTALGVVDGKYFLLYDVNGSVGVWIDEDDSGTSIPTGASAANRAIEITTINTGDNAETRATKLATAIALDAEFGTALNGTEVDVTDAKNGERTAAANGDTPFTISRVQQGLGNTSPSNTDVIGKLRLFGTLRDLDLTRQDGSGGSLALTLADNQVLFIEIPASGDQVYDADGALIGNYRIVDIDDFEIKDEYYWVAYRENSSVYIRGAGFLASGDESNIGGGVTDDTLSYIGANSSTDSTPNYSSTEVVTQGANLTQGISELDAAAAALIPLKQDRNHKTIEGGTWSWIQSTGTLTWSASAYIQLPGLANNVNEISAASVVLDADGKVAHITVKRTSGASTPSVTAEAIDAMVVDGDEKIFARRVGNDVLIGESFLLKDGELLELDGALAEINRYFGQLQIKEHATNKDRVTISGIDVAKLNGSSLSLQLQNTLLSFDGAEIDFSTGVIYEDDGVSALGINFTPETLVASEYFYYSITLTANAILADNTLSAQITVTPAASGHAVLATAPKALFVSGGLPLGMIYVQDDGAAGAGTIENIAQLNITQLGVGGSGGGGGLNKWEDVTDYKIDDVVWYETDRNIYVATADHTSSGSLDETKFELLSDDGYAVTLGETVAVGDSIYISIGNAAGDTGRTLGSAYLLDVTDANRSDYAGICVKGGNVSDVAIISSGGNVKGFAGLPTGKLVYGSESTPGDFQTTRPTTIGNRVIILGISKDATHLILNGALSSIVDIVTLSTDNADTIHLIKSDELASIADIDLSGNNADFDGGGTITASSLTLSTTATDLLKSAVQVVKYSPGADGSSDYFGWTRSIPLAYRGRFLRAQIEYKNSSTTLSGDFRFCMKQTDGTDAGDIQYFDMLAHYNTNNTGETWNGTFEIAEDCTEIEFGIQNLSTTTTVSINIDNILITSDVLKTVNVVKNQTYEIRQAATSMTSNVGIVEYNLGTAIIETDGDNLITASNVGGDTRFVASEKTQMGFSVSGNLADAGYLISVKKYNSSDVLVNSYRGNGNYTSTAACLTSGETKLEVGEYLVIDVGASNFTGTEEVRATIHASSLSEATLAVNNILKDWNDYNPVIVGSGTSTTNEARWIKEGKNLRGFVHWANGTPAATEMQIPLPNNLTIGSDNVTLANQVVGDGYGVNAANPNISVLATTGDTYVNLGFQDAGHNEILTPINSTGHWAAPFQVVITFLVPIEGWSDTPTLLALPNSKENHWSALITGSLAASFQVENESGLSGIVVTRTGTGAYKIDYSALNLSSKMKGQVSLFFNDNSVVYIDKDQTHDENEIHVEMRNHATAATDIDFFITLTKSAPDYTAPGVYVGKVDLIRTAYIKDVKAYGNAGGTSSTDTTHIRDLNTLTGDSSFISLSSNQFTLSSGKYSISSSAPGYQTNGHQIYLYNISDSTYDIEGTSEGLDDSLIHQTHSRLEGEINITSSTIYEIRHWVRTGEATQGLGYDAKGSGNPPATNNIFTQVKIIKVA